MERYIGIDVHRDSTTICVVSATGKRIRREIVETNGQVLVRYLMLQRGTLHVCIEESAWSEPRMVSRVICNAVACVCTTVSSMSLMTRKLELGDRTTTSQQKSIRAADATVAEDPERSGSTQGSQELESQIVPVDCRDRSLRRAGCLGYPLVG